MESRTLLQTLINELTSDDCKSQFAIMKSQITLQPNEEAEINHYFDSKISNLVTSAQDVCIDGDESELQRLLPHIWIEFRMEWIRYNTQMQYQTVIRGQAEPSLAMKGGALSFLIAIIEKFLTNDEIYWCTKLAADPILQLKSRSTLVQRMVQYASVTSEANQNIVENLAQLKDEIYDQTQDSAIYLTAEKTLTTVEKLLTDATALTPKDLHESLESVMTGILKDFKVPLVLSQMSDNSKILIPAVTVAGINRVFKEWLENLKQGAVENSIEERRQAGKTDHLSITWSVQEGVGGRLTLYLEEDGLGQLQNLRFKELPEDWDFQQTQNPGKGSKLQINFKGTELAEMILFNCQGPKENFSFAIPASQVREILSESQIQFRSDNLISYARIRHEDKIYPMIDLTEVMFDVPASSDSGIFIKVIYGNGEGVVIRASSVETLLRDTMKKGPATLHFIQGYLTRQKRVFSVVDVAKLREVVDGKHSIAKVA